MFPLRLTLYFLVACAIFVACQMSPEQQSTLTTYFNQQLMDGHITREQYDALMASLQGNDWSQITDILVNTGLSLLAGFTGIRLWRGPATRNSNVAQAAAAKSMGNKP
jgi:hypothetical protein